MHLILGLGSKARSGKDSVANAIVDYLNGKRVSSHKHDYPVRIPQVRKLAFATELRKEVSAAIEKAGSIEKLLIDGFVDDVEGRQINIPLWVEPEPHPDFSDPLLPFGKHSKLLQWWGTEYRRSQNPNYWVDKLRSQLLGLSGVSIVTDVRFYNEAELIRELGGFNIRVTRLQSNGELYAAPDRPKNHPSEINLDSYNWDQFITVKEGDGALRDQIGITMYEFLQARIN